MKKEILEEKEVYVRPCVYVHILSFESALCITSLNGNDDAGDEGNEGYGPDEDEYIWEGGNGVGAGTFTEEPLNP